jgi:hypothetical protein
MAKFGILLNSTHTTYTNATSAEQLVPRYIRSVIEDMERCIIPSGGLVEALQKWHNEYAECLIENCISDNGEPDGTIITIESSADHLMNQGWITRNKTSIDNRKQYDMILAYMQRKGIQDYDGTEFAQKLMKK